MIYLFTISSAIAVLAGLSLWALRGPAGKHAASRPLPAPEPSGVRHATHLPLIRQALSREDLDYLRSRATRALMSHARRERQDVVLAYLQALRGEFKRLLAVARVVAVLSPEVDATDEIQRLRLTLRFAWRFELVRLRVRYDFAPLAGLASLGNMVGALNLRLEMTIKDIGERAALASEIASALDRRGSDTVA